MNRLSLKLGLCALDDYRVDCAFERSACDDPSDWRSPGVLTGNENYRGRGDFCLRSEALREKVLGRCEGRGDGSGRGRGDGTGGGSGDGSGLGHGVGEPCAPNRESCQDANADFFDDRVPFEEGSPDCTVEATTFGRCGDRCSWSPADCGPDEEWTFPAEGCKCGDVRTGGCVRRDGLGILGDAYCAVSGGACDVEQGWEWMSPLEMAASVEVDAECYVCIRATAPVIGQGPSIPTVTGSKEDSKEGSSPSPSVVIGAAVGGSLLVALLASLLITRRLKKQQSKSAEAELKQMDSNATTISVAIIGMDLNLENANEDELVSNLDVEDLESSKLDVEDLEHSDIDEAPNLNLDGEDLESSDKNEVSHRDVEDFKKSDQNDVTKLDENMEKSDND